MSNQLERSSEDSKNHGPWNPGLSSQIPQRLMPLVTLFRPENADVGYSEALELSDLFGLSVEDLASFRADRLIIHELLVRVTADLSVPDGPNYEDLGINLRGMVDTIFTKYIPSEREAINALLEKLRDEATRFIEAELKAIDNKRNAKTEPHKSFKSWFASLFASRKQALPKTSVSQEQTLLEAIKTWQTRQSNDGTPFEKACLTALEKVVTTSTSHRGRLVGDRSLTARIAARMVCNSYGSEAIGRAIEPIIKSAAKAEGYCFLPSQPNPLVLNVKGASASGKSTIRSQQRQLAEKIGIAWEDFALISPDYWRKYLLDYESLCDDYKYAAMLTGRELEIIDKKLDRYMTEKAARGCMSHLLIDRFRFDSFSPQQHREADSRLLTRFGDTIYFFFMITPPEATVERAWSRGLKTGRFKAVDDLLYHNIEAYTGMPPLFFSWAKSSKKRVHYEFLDNSVAEGKPPRTVAFGWNGKMTILDLDVMRNIENFRHINIEAKSRDEIYEDDKTSNVSEASFLRQCAQIIPDITLADFDSGAPYARLIDGICVWINCDHDNQKTESKKTQIEQTFGVTICMDEDAEAPRVLEILNEQRFTVGTWGRG